MVVPCHISLAIPLLLQMVSANMDGELILKIETDTVLVATYFKDLINHQFGMRDSKIDTVEGFMLN